MSCESTAEPIKFGYLMDFTSPSDSPPGWGSVISSHLVDHIGEE